MSRRTRPRQFLFAISKSGEDAAASPSGKSFGNDSGAYVDREPLRKDQAKVITKKKIVLVDDDALVRTTYDIALRVHGFEVTAVMADGSELLEKIDSLKPIPNVILLDERMPRVSGVEACRLIRTKYPEISVILVSADGGARQNGLRAGAKLFLQKPVSINDLITAIDSV